MESVGMMGFVYPQSWGLGSVRLQLRSRKESGYLIFPHRTLGGWTGSSLRTFQLWEMGHLTLSQVLGHLNEEVPGKTCFTEQRFHPYLLGRLPLGLC